MSAILHWQRHQTDQAVTSIITTFKLLKSRPWGSSQLLDAVLRVTAEVADDNPKAALLIYQELDEPFAMYRLEDQRLLLRYVLSETLGSTYAVEARIDGAECALEGMASREPDPGLCPGTPPTGQRGAARSATIPVVGCEERLRWGLREFKTPRARSVASSCERSRASC